MKLTKKQQQEISRLINENLQGVLKGRMVEAHVDETNVQAIIENLVLTLERTQVSAMKDELVANLTSGVFQYLPSILRAYGVGEFSRADIEESLINDQVVELQDSFTEQLDVIVKAYLNDLVELIVHGLTQEDEDF